MREVDGVTDLDVVCQGDVLDLNTIAISLAQNIYIKGGRMGKRVRHTLGSPICQIV